MRVYIAGPISGIPGGNREAFAAAAARIRGLGHEVVDPHELCAHLPDEAAHAEYMRTCLPEVCRSDSITLLPGWEGSKGALAELLAAVSSGLAVSEEGRQAWEARDIKLSLSVAIDD